MLQPAYKPKSKALESLPPGARAFQQIGKINTCLKEIKPGQLRDENPSYFSWPSLHSLPSQLSSLPPHLHLKQLPWCLGFHCESCPATGHCPVPMGCWKMQRCLGRVIYHTPKALKWIWLSDPICLEQNILWEKDTGNKKGKYPPRKELGGSSEDGQMQRVSLVSSPPPLNLSLSQVIWTLILRSQILLCEMWGEESVWET